MDVGSGVIVPGTGQAQFKVEYNAIVFKPFKNEVVDGVVNNVSKMGIFLDVGPLSVFVSSHVSFFSVLRASRRDESVRTNDVNISIGTTKILRGTVELCKGKGRWRHLTLG